MVVEDDKDARDLLEMAIRARGHEVVSAVDADSAWDAYLRQPVPFLMVDWLLPGRSGLDLIRQIRGQAEGMQPVILVCTVRTETIHLQEVLDAGADDYLPKPIDYNLLQIRLAVMERCVQQNLDRQRMQEQRERLEAQLRQSQKMEAVGQLAGGVAHDFNNLLTVILGRGQLVLARRSLEAPVKQDVELICNTAERAAALTRQLLTFSRRQVVQAKVFNLNLVVSELSAMLKRLIGEHIEFTTALAEDLGSVKADPSQIEQVIMNLVVNGRDAMPAGGKLILETANITLDKALAGERAFRPGRYVMLAVSDTGSGMTPEIKDHLFEPFFTTKEKGKGTGLGLSTVYGIVKNSGGEIWVYSEPGMGATFKIFLPREDLQPQPARVSTTLRPADAGQETILYVEDDDSVRQLVREVLCERGYTVLEAHDGAEAIRVRTCHAGKVDLLITDVVMPAMNGSELVKRLSAAWPALKVLYMSGYASNAAVHCGAVPADAAFLEKPFSPHALHRKIREVLETENGA